MPLGDAIALIEEAERAELDELLMQRWIPIQFEMSFAEFKAKILKPKKTEKEIMTDVENILASVCKEGI